MDDLRTVLTSVFQVFALIGFGWAYARWRKPDLQGLLQLSMQLFIPCLAFVSIYDTRVAPSLLLTAGACTVIQIGAGLLFGWGALRLLGLGRRRELLLPISFVNAANLAFPLVLANFGQDGLSLGVVCYIVMSVLVYTAGVFILHGGARPTAALREPALWGALLAVVIRLLRIDPPAGVLDPARLAAQAAVPVMLVLFGDSLSRARMADLRPSVTAAFLRYATGAIGLAVALPLLKPQGLTRQVLIFYALLPSAMVTALLAQRAGRDPEAVASTVTLTTLAGLLILPVLLAWLT